MKIVLSLLLLSFSSAQGSCSSEDDTSYDCEICHESSQEENYSCDSSNSDDYSASNSDKWHTSGYGVFNSNEKILNNYELTITEQGIKQKGASRLSINCFLFGNGGCETKCNFKCTIHDCTPRTTSCDDSFHCNCDEVYLIGCDQLAPSEIEFLEFNDLWKETFGNDFWAEKNRKLIRDDQNKEKYILGLLRNVQLSGADIITLLKDKYPYWSQLRFLESSRQRRKAEFTVPGKPLRYKDLDDHFDEILEAMGTQPLDSIGKMKYRRKIKKYLTTITDIDDLEELLHLIKLSENNKLYRLTKSILRDLGYGFEEDGDRSTGKKVILRTNLGGLDEADEDEIIDVAILNKYLSKDTVDTMLKDEATSKQTVGLQKTKASETQIVTSDRPIQSNMMVSEALPINSLSVPSVSALAAPTNALTNVASFTNTNSGGIADGSMNGSTLYYLVVDENGMVVQASGVPKSPISFPMNQAQWNMGPPYPYYPINTPSNFMDFNFGYPFYSQKLTETK